MMHGMFGFILAAVQAVVSPLATLPTYAELGQIDLSPKAEHCWKAVKDGRVGIGFGLTDALLVETKWADYHRAGIEPSIGMRLFSRHNASAAYPALVVAISGEVVTVATDFRLIGSFFVEPHEPLAIYASDTRMPAITPRSWTNNLSRADLLKMMSCYEKEEARSV